MMKSIILQTLRQRRVSTIWWSIGIIVYIVLVMASYAAFQDQAAELEKSFGNFSDTEMALFTDTQSLFTPDGYLSSQIYYLMLPLLLSVLSISLGASLLAKDESNKTIELLLSRPISRGKLLVARAFSGIIVLSIVSAAAAISGGITVHLMDYGSIGFMDVVTATKACMMVALIFGSIAFAIASIGKFGKASIAVSVLLALVSYLFSSLSATVKWMDGPAKLLPFDYFHPAEMLNGSRPYVTMLTFLVVSVVLGIVAYIGFRRRDLE